MPLSLQTDALYLARNLFLSILSQRLNIKYILLNYLYLFLHFLLFGHAMSRIICAIFSFILFFQILRCAAIRCRRTNLGIRQLH